MASPIEVAVVELQIVVREFSKRLARIEERLGLHPEEFARPSEGGRSYVPLAREKRAERRAESSGETYGIVGATTTADPARQRWSVAPSTPLSTPASTTGQASAAAGEASATPEPAPMAGSSPASAAPVMAEVQAAGENSPAGTPMAASDSTKGSASGQAASDPAQGEGPMPVQPPDPPLRPEPTAARVAAFVRAYTPPPPPPRFPLERALGLEVASWLAALAIMAAVVFFLQWGMEESSAVFGPALRVGMALGAGALMIGCGVWLHRRRLVSISGALLGTGLAIMMVALFAAHIGFATPILSQIQALGAVAMVAGLGILLGYYTRSAALPILAFLGMYAAPAVFGGMPERPVEVLTYLLIVTLGALILAQLRRAWDVLRLGAFVAAWTWLIIWTSGESAAVHGTLGVTAVAVATALFLATAVLNIRLALVREPAQAPVQSEPAAFWDLIGAVGTMANSILAAISWAVVYQQAQLQGLWAPVAILAAVMGVLALTARTPHMTISAAAQSLGLFLLAVPLYLEGGTIMLGWAVMALGLGLYARLMRSPFARLWMFVALVLMAWRLVTLDAVDPALAREYFRAGGTPVTAWMLMGWGGALLALVLAWLCRPTSRVTMEGTALRGSAWATIACVSLSTLLVFVVNVRALEPGDLFTLVALLWSLALLAVLRLGALAEVSGPVETLIGVLLALLTVKWFVYDGATLGMQADSNPMPLWNLFTLNAVLLAAAVFVLHPVREQPPVGRRAMAWWITALALGLLNIQVLQTVGYFTRGLSPDFLGGPQFIKSVSLTALWALFGAGMVAVGFVRHAPTVRYAALGLLALAVGKILLIDMAMVGMPLRVLGFATLGVLLFVVSYLYHRNGQQLPTGRDGIAGQS